MADNTQVRQPSTGFSLRNLSVAAKLRCMAAVTCVILLVMGVIAIMQLGSAQDRLESMYNTNLQNTKSLDDLAVAYRDMRLAIRVLAFAQNDADTETAATRVQNSFTTVDSAMKEVTTLHLAGSDTDVETLGKTFSSYIAIAQAKLIPAAKAHQYAEFNQITSAQVNPLSATVDASLGSLLQAESGAAETSIDDSANAYDSARILMIALVVVALAFTFGMVFLISRSISGPLQRTVHVLTGLAAGRLDQRLEVRSRRTQQRARSPRRHGRHRDRLLRADQQRGRPDQRRVAEPLPGRDRTGVQRRGDDLEPGADDRRHLPEQ
jgi:methyl-accepting chemotaxis protein